ncbi:hypothetical protein MNBD_GAMMA09-1910 [hydrothermal vent metagenome]|uniref:Uncharacterized protein n=1 Tax=hydrothermal vent metagenome TaxID=652676 RepID=A0A3B0Y0M4_9ZZZZ
MDTDQRKKLVSQLINYEDEPRHLVNLLRAFGWDCETELVTLTKNHLENALNLFIANKIQAKDLLCWAECIEGREDISFESSHAEIIDACISWFVNPGITSLITPDVANIIKADLNTNQLKDSYLLMQLNSTGEGFYTHNSQLLNAQNDHNEYTLAEYVNTEDALKLEK